MSRAKYKQVIDYYKNYIAEHELSDGELLPSESKVAEKLDFSRDTVRRALDQLEKENIVHRQRGKGTFYKNPDLILADKKIAVITTYLSNYIFPKIISGIEEVVSSKHYTLTLTNTDNNPDKERKSLKRIIESDVDGLIIEPTKSAVNKRNLDLYQELKKKEIPFVMLNAYFRELNPSYAIVNDYKGAYRATKYLLQLGHKNIAGIFKEDDLQGIFRQKGFEKALAEYNVNLDNINIGNYITSQIESYPYHYVDQLLKKENRPTALFCYNDEIAVTAIKAIMDNHLKIPEDISIIGFDDSILATSTSVKFTSVRHPKEDLGRHAARLLFNMLEIGVKKSRFLYDPELIVRDSCQEIRRRR